MPVFTARADSLNQQVSFFVDSGFSKNEAVKIDATLKGSYDNVYFYFEDSWWNDKKQEEYPDLFSKMSKLASEFDSNIYPQLTSTFGNEANPGIDKDKKITVLFYSMKDNARGYVRNIDEYDRLVNPYSNQREMLYLNVDNLDSPLMKSFLAHEFMHLITFNQKEMKYNVAEDVWLNEARAEYAPTLLGYNDNLASTNYLSNRVKSFINSPSTSLIDWDGSIDDYGAVSIFVHYLVDHYGSYILVDSLKSKEVGIESINQALLKNNIKERFNDIYTNFTIAVYLNDCSVSAKYCFKNPNLVDLHILPFSNYLPFSGDSNLYLGQNIKNYTAHWQKFSGGVGTLKLTFKSSSNAEFVIPYIVKNISGDAIVNFLEFNQNQSSDLLVPGIGKDIASVILIPSVQQSSLDTKVSYYYSLTAASFFDTNANQGDDLEADEIKLPFTIDKPLSQMNREELLTVLLKLIITLLTQGRLIPIQ